MKMKIKHLLEFKKDDKYGYTKTLEFAKYLEKKLLATFKSGYVDFYETEVDENSQIVEYEFTWKFLNAKSLSHIQNFIKKEKQFNCSLGTGEDLIILTIEVPKHYIQNYLSAWGKMRDREDQNKGKKTYIRPTEWRKEKETWQS